MELADQTDALTRRGAAWLTLAGISHRVGDIEAASAAVERAADLFDQKENAVAAERARALFADLAVR